MALAVASRYARALVDAVTAAGAGIDPKQAVEQLRAFEQVLAASAELRSILLSPAVPPARKRAVVSRLGEPLGLSKAVRNFLLVVIDRRRILLLGEMVEAFESLLDERLGVVRADVTAARELSEAERGRLREELARLTGKKVRCEYAVDADLLGGVVARIGSRIYDGSVRGQLEALRNRLVE